MPIAGRPVNVSGSAAGKSSRISAVSQRIPGMLASGAIAAIALLLGHEVPVIGAPVFGIAIGMLIRSVVKPPMRLKPGIAFTSKYVLQASVVLLGAGLSFATLWHTGLQSLPVMLGTLVLAYVAMGVFGKLLRVGGDLRLLIGSGTAICGGSAIAAVTGVIGASEAAVAYSMTTIFAFNAVAVLTFPALGHAFGLSQHAFGVWSGTAVNDTSSVVAAASIYGDSALSTAVVVKLVRTTMIIPVCIGIALWRAWRRPAAAAEAEAAGPDLDGTDMAETAATTPRPLRWKNLTPWFVVWFLVASLINTAGAVPDSWHDGMSLVSKILITASLSAIGLSAQFGEMRKHGLRPIFLGGAIWFFVAGSSLLLQALTGTI